VIAGEAPIRCQGQVYLLVVQYPSRRTTIMCRLAATIKEEQKNNQVWVDANIDCIKDSSPEALRSHDQSFLPQKIGRISDGIKFI
jgi:hypothetical protein